ncbi:FKBP-type peptidyl-prolyl cis-trans isomerase [Mucilaginibacter boryungensis]|uniref:peptidylprolyl isomerase n=1 Tax=Mucilaginibacter boryungensis TaxID=768480 RepID=A0ABR9XBU2_9SPHI|nr:FKBP-type peptidyl-prolyl cis-trans isomerase [Mucilaginibacter boryungensis]MBE9664832.1 FKBP-type peptidyl-prolyl cis-trans isomerase [Mucilaginibacter boryungensis]
MKKFLFLACLIAPVALKAQDGYMRTPKGVQYKIVSKNAGERIKMDDVITFHVVQKTEKDSVLFSSYNLGHAIKAQVKPSTNIGDLMEVFPLLTAKDSVLVKVPTDSVFIGHEDARPPFLPKGSNIVFIVKIEKVQSLNDAIAERNAQMDKMKSEEARTADQYINSHKLVLKSTPSGLKYVVTKVGPGRKVMLGDTVLVNYTGRTTEDKIFDTSIEAAAKTGGVYQPGRPYEPLKIVLGQTQLIRGWDEGLQLLTEGSKAEFIVPSSLGYGEQGAGDDIKPFSTLVFDLQVVKVIHPKPVVAKTKTAAKTTAKPGAKAPVKKPVPAPAKKPATAPVKK